MRFISFLFAVTMLVSCQEQSPQYRKSIDLSGTWQFALDQENNGISEQWYLSDLNDSILLPGTTDLNQKGIRNTDTTTMHLNRVYKYEGPAWYRKEVEIPADFEDKHIRLVLERTKVTTIWIDDQLIGESKLLQAPQKFDVSDYLTPGKHVITIRVDNNHELTPYGHVHIYADDTQTNWNGIIGDIKLIATPKTYISNLQVYPDVENKKARVELGIVNRLDLDNVDVELLVKMNDGEKTSKLQTHKATFPVDSILSLEYDLSDNLQLWDEYNQPVYELTAVIKNNEIADSKTVQFGMRNFTVEGTQFTINGRTTFLRGKHEAAVFPETGHVPMDREGWARVYRIAKSYGINHYRFHSYCPPKAAFEAADQEGIYLQAELPFWGGLESDSVMLMLRNEGYAMLKEYANHPSFVMFSPGNEIWSGHDRVEQNMVALKEFDDRPLYAIGSNNNIGYMWPRDYAEFFVCARTPSDGDTILSHTRLTHAHADSRDGGLLNTQEPSTDFDFSYSVERMDMPIVSHEIAQYQIYPDYDEIDKYTGPVRAWNFEVFRDRLEEAGMLDQNKEFQKASGAWSALCYKAEMEAAIRTRGFGGFQLLDLQDFPGQGTALVGILDAFMDDKGVVSREDWLQSCNDVVLLLEFPKYTWQNNETYAAELVIANYSNKTLSGNVNWELRNQSGEKIKQGTFADQTIQNEGLTTIGTVSFSLDMIQQAEKLQLFVETASNQYTNDYPIWVYPVTKPQDANKKVLITQKLGKQTLTALKAGEKLLLMPSTEDVKENSVPGLFISEFWNYGMFKGISEWANKPVSPGTLGILTDPEHAVFNDFPTDFHTNWQWFSIIKASNSLNLNATDNDYRPIVQMIDNLERNNKYGLLFEFKVGEGNLLVCMSQLDKILDEPEAAQYYQSILNYMNSDAFNPTDVAEEDLLQKLLGKAIVYNN